MNPARRTTQAATTALVLATAGTLLSAAAPAASAATTCVSPVYKRQFFANTTFSGTPKKTDCDTAVAENWGAKAPATGLPKDNFGVRWTVTRDFGSGGPFTLTAAAQDGVRVYLDGKVKVNVWKNVTTTQKKTVDLAIPKGKHTIRVDYANFTGNANVNFAYTPRTSATIDKVKPLAPTAPAITYDKVTGKAKLTWAKNKEMDLAGYRVYRRLNSGDSWKRLSATTGTSYTDTLPATGETYYYEVRAYDKAGNESAGSADKSVTTEFGAPQGLVATSTRAANSLTWKAGPGATSYEVYRALGDNGTFELVAEVGSPAYTDETAVANVPYAYKVRGLNAAGSASAYSAVVWATRDTVAPPAPEGLRLAAADEGGVTLIWQSSGPDTAKYYIYRSSTSMPGGPRIGSASTTAYRDTSAEPGQLYTYVVTAVDAAGNESTWKSLVTATRPVGPSSAPKPPAIMNPSIVNNRLSMSFSNSGYVPVSGYEVYRSRTTPVDTTVAANHFGGGGTSFQATVSENEYDYYYAVVAVSTYGVRSVPSFSFRPVVVPVTQLPLPVNAVQAVPGDGQVQLLWDARPQGPTDQVIVGYRVYRSTTPGFTKETAESSFLTHVTTYTDKGLTNGTTYYYAVASVAETGTESALSPEVTATPTA